MFDNIFGIHEQALLLHGQRLGVLATNLANADTPNYKARDIDFSEVLAHSDGWPVAAAGDPGGPYHVVRRRAAAGRSEVSQSVPGFSGR